MVACGGDGRGDYRGACGGTCRGACCGVAVACCGACHLPRDLPRRVVGIYAALAVGLAIGSRTAVCHGKFHELPQHVMACRGLPWYAVASHGHYGMSWLTMGTAAVLTPKKQRLYILGKCTLFDISRRVMVFPVGCHGDAKAPSWRRHGNFHGASWYSR